MNTMKPIGKALGELWLAPAHKRTSASRAVVRRSPTPQSRAASSNSSSATEVAVCLDKLGRVFGFPPAWDEISAGIWIDALSGIPLDLLCESVDRYIREPSDSPKYFPRPHQLRALIADQMPAPRHRSALPEPERTPPTPEEAAELRAKYPIDISGGTPCRPDPLYVIDSADDQPSLWSAAWRKRVGIS